jgi:hypothetical protein
LNFFFLGKFAWCHSIDCCLFLVQNGAAMFHLARKLSPPFSYCAPCSMHTVFRVS